MAFSTAEDCTKVLNRLKETMINFNITCERLNDTTNHIDQQKVFDESDLVLRIYTSLTSLCQVEFI